MRRLYVGGDQDGGQTVTENTKGDCGGDGTKQTTMTYGSNYCVDSRIFLSLCTLDWDSPEPGGIVGK